MLVIPVFLLALYPSAKTEPPAAITLPTHTAIHASARQDTRVGRVKDKSRNPVLLDGSAWKSALRVSVQVSWTSIKLATQRRESAAAK